MLQTEFDRRVMGGRVYKENKEKEARKLGDLTITVDVILQIRETIKNLKSETKERKIQAGLANELERVARALGQLSQKAAHNIAEYRSLQVKEAAGIMSDSDRATLADRLTDLEVFQFRLAEDYLKNLKEKAHQLAEIRSGERSLAESLATHCRFEPRLNEADLKILEEDAFEIVIGVETEVFDNAVMVENGRKGKRRKMALKGNESIYIHDTPFILVRGKEPTERTGDSIRHEKIHNETDHIANVSLPSVLLEEELGALAGSDGNFLNLEGETLLKKLKKIDAMFGLHGEWVAAGITSLEGDHNPFTTITSEMEEIENILSRYATRSERGEIKGALYQYQVNVSEDLQDIMKNIDNARKVAQRISNERAVRDLEALLVALEPRHYRYLVKFLEYSERKGRYTEPVR